ncbi:flagellar assembly protein FliW, partial [Pantoea sp. SIMBA_079]
FWLIDPFPFFQDYEFKLKDSHKQSLEIKDDTPISVLNILTVRSGDSSTVNLKAPVIINLENKKAKQVILEEERFEVRQPLMHHASKQDK